MKAFSIRGAEKLAAEAPSPAAEEQTVVAIVAASPEDTKKLRLERADQIRVLSATDFDVNKDALIAELKTLKSVDCGWCNKAPVFFFSDERGTYL